MQQRSPLQLLFVCSMNQWRSPTAEKVYADDPYVTARSGGTNRGARKNVSEKDVDWADLVLVMEQKHKQKLLSNFPAQMRNKQVYVLDIPDNYRYMDPELIAEITAVVDPLIAAHSR